MVQESRLEVVGSGLTPVSDGWFVVNVGEAAWLRHDAFGGRCVFESSGRVLADRIEIADNFFTRALGLMFRRRRPAGNGLWITSCNGIHMFFMSFPIDAVFLDSRERVRKVYRKLPRWYGVVWWEIGARSVLELPPDSTSGIDLQRGDQIIIQ